MTKDKIEKIIKEIISKILNESENSVELQDFSFNKKDNKEIFNFSFKIRNSYLFTKNEGEVIDSLTYLIRRITEAKFLKDSANNELDSLIQINIDINDFKKKKIESLKATAHMMAERARYFKSNIEMDPMPSFERMVVHEFLSNTKDLKTESLGFGKERRVIIKYLGGI